MAAARAQKVQDGTFTREWLALSKLAYQLSTMKHWHKHPTRCQMDT
ncbi:hypothetical protein A2U01_0102254 [Trifolium medium]|uniref:Uncharacterized protein n=1 Tax=Trifolium medium TaxID=97028 RepID=A0A392V0Q0_9FABA|nr:hypothetical protein [Trifolium medium]